MRITEEGRRVTEETSSKLRDYISKLPKIFSDEDKDLLKKINSKI